MNNFLYHGTKVLPEIFLKEGLKPAKINDIIEKIKIEFSIENDVADEIFYDIIRRKKSHLFVYFTDRIEEARSYAQIGGNFEGNLRSEVCHFLKIPDNRNHRGYVIVIKNKNNEKGEIKFSYIGSEEIIFYFDLN